MWKIIWIDLGTTNSCFSYMVWEKSEIISNAEWDRTTPSVVYLKDKDLLVGRLAKNKAILSPKNVLYEIKRFIGRKYDEVKEEIKNLPYEVKKWSDGWVLLVVDWKEYKSEQISAFILKKIKEDAEKFLWQKVDNAVITVPAYFNDSQRNATKAAWEIAWLKVERIINEPTAAALSYGLGKNKDEKVAVFDFGWWTFDITILEIWAEWTFQVLSTNGDTHLGGADLDKVLIDWLRQRFQEKDWINLDWNVSALQRLKEEAEKAKIQLSQADQVEINIPFIITGPDWTPKHVQEILTRAEFEKMIKSFVERTREPVLSALKDAELSPSDINEIILVWGSTRIPLVKKVVGEIFGKEPKASVNPDEAVALWAWIQWWILQWDVNDILLLDVTPLSLWVEVEWRMVDVVISRNTTIPVKKNKTYTTAVDNQPAVTINVLQWERPMASDNKSLGTFNLDWIPPMRRWQAQIEVTFDIDANGILNVSAKEKTTWKEQKVTIQWATWISDEEIKKAQAEAEKFADEDKKKKELIEAKNKIETMWYQIETLATENKEKLSAEDLEKLNKMAEEAKSYKTNETATKEEIESKLTQMQNDLNEFYQKMNPQAWAQWQEQTNQWPDDNAEEQVVDA